MIISKKHKYLFIELPRTGSTAISKELVENYDGEPIFQKHTPYSYFLKRYPELENEYFVFSGIRNPLDRTVSLFFHLDKTLKAKDRRMELNNSFIKKVSLHFSRNYFLRRYQYVKKNNADFSEYFLKFYRYPYVDWSILAHRKFDFIIKFENLNNDFQEVLKLIGIESKRDLPVINKTKGRDAEFLKYFDDKAIEKAKNVFGIYMKELKYDFPKGWGAADIKKYDKLKFRIKLSMMKIFWHIIYSI